AAHVDLQAALDLVELPVELRTALDPFEVGDDHAPGVREDVGDDDHASSGEHPISVGGDGTVGAFHDDLRPDARRVVLSDLRFERGGDQDVHVQGEQLGVADPGRAGEPLERPV